MMDDFLSKAVDFGVIPNGTVADKETTDNITVDLKSEEKTDNNCSILEVSPRQIKIENSYPGSFSMDIEKNREHGVQDNLSQETNSKVETKTPLLCSIYRRRKARQKEIAFDREYKKLEKIFISRGLPVDRESLCSATNKDPFDMRSLDESLPSTFETKVVHNEVGKKWHPKLESNSCHVRPHLERLERLKNYSLTSYTPMLSRLLPPSDWNLSAENDTICASMLRGPRQRRAHWDRKSNKVISLHFDKTPAYDKQKETSKVREEKSQHIWACQGREMNGDSDLNTGKNVLNISGQTINGIPLGVTKEETRKENQNSDVENNHQNTGFAPVSKLCEDMNQCSIWNTGKNYSTDFLFSGINPQFKSSNEREGDVDRSKSPLSMAEIRQNTLRQLREQNKLKAMYSRRGVLSEDMNESETENLSIKIDSRISNDCNQNNYNFQSFAKKNRLSKKEYEALLDMWKTCRLMLSRVGTSAQNIRGFKNHFSVGNLKSDKVVPD